ncbi:MAG TPA: MotA/TolQ/ExbB proton channel family protein [Candidatus Polarisedimenticolia bacterium]|nr:MotA/TolQ/ExbB proton channel family protein [Candidatus Polarisedimenticolia bacterium]
MSRNVAFATLLLAGALASNPVEAQAAGGGAPLAPVAGSVRQDLEKSLAELKALRESIETEKVPLAKEMSSLESRLRDLKGKQDSGARSNDETGLEVGQLKEAAHLREEEVTYVGNLLDEFTRNFESTLHVSETGRYAASLEAAKLATLNKDLAPKERFARQTEVVRQALTRAEDLLGGTRYPGKAVDASGTVDDGTFAMIGPVVLFAAKDGHPSGLATPQAGSDTPAVRALPEKTDEKIAELVEKGKGSLPLDPSRGGALQALIARGSLFGYFKKGGPIMWPLLFVSLLASSVIIERLLFLAGVRRGRDPEAIIDILAKVEMGDVDGAIRRGQGTKDFVARTLVYAMTHREKSLSGALMRAGAKELVRFTRGIAILDTVITMAPLLGLLGTVTGMMGSFGMLGGAELSAPAQITGGIAEALIATAFGLGIAISSLVPLNFLHNKNEEARHAIEDAASHLELLMKPIMEAETRFGSRGSEGRLAEALPGPVMAAKPGSSLREYA